MRLPALRPEPLRFLRFCVVGSSGVLVNLSFVALGLALTAGLAEPIQKGLSSALGILVSVFTNFLINSVWTWSDRQKSAGARGWFGRVSRYYLASGAAIGIQFATAQGLAQGLQWNLYLAQCIGIVLGTLVNYLANNRWTFANRC